MTYDRAERLTEIRDALNGNRLVKSFTYASANGGSDWRNGKLWQAVRYNHAVFGPTDYETTMTETFKYGGREGRLSQRDIAVHVNGGPQESFTQGYTYDVLGNVSSLSYPQCLHAGCPASPRTVSFSYGNGFLTGVPGYASSISYHSNQQLNQIANANGITTTYALDPNSMARPASISTNAGWSTGTYAYDGSGNVVKIGSSWYLYDGVSRLAQSSTVLGVGGTGSVATQNLTYDAFGNIQTVTNNGVPRATPTSTSTNRLTGGGPVYDGAGNINTWNGNEYRYDPMNSMWTFGSGSEHWIYHYTSDDERTWAYDLLRNQSYWAIRGLDGRVLREYFNNAGTWSVLQDYIYAGDKLIATETPSGTQHLHTDHLGTVRQITNAAGAQVAYHVYFPFGEEATAFNQDSEQMKFTGHERDFANPNGPGDDLDYMHARFFSPVTARFLSVDPVLQVDRAQRAPQLWNRYAYGLGSPIKYLDPTGLVAQGLFGSIFDLLSTKLKEAFPPQAPSPMQNIEVLASEIGLSGSQREHFDQTKVERSVQTQLIETTASAGASVGTAGVLIGGNVLSSGAINVMTKGFGHAVARHTVVGTETSGKSIFRSNVNLVELVRAAEKVTPRPQQHGNLAFVVNSGRAIGYDVRTGGPTAFYTVITDARRNLVTMFPGMPRR